MSQIGEIKLAREIGYKSGHKGGSRYIWQACMGCGKERWVMLQKGSPCSIRCQDCARKIGSRPQGGRRVTKRGYIDVKVHPDDFFYTMAIRGYVPEHRLVVAKALGRNLHSWEIVHHKGTKYPKGSIKNKQDNRYPENLQLVMEGQHNQITIMEQRIKHLENRVTILEAENIALKAVVDIEGLLI